MLEKERQILQIRDDFDIIYFGNKRQPGILHRIEAIVRQCEGQTTDVKHKICRILMKHFGVSFDLGQQHAITSEFIIAHFGAFLKQTLDGQPFGTGPVNTDNHVVVRQIRDKLFSIYKEVKKMYDELVRHSMTHAPLLVSNSQQSDIEMTKADAIALIKSRAQAATARDARARAWTERGYAHAGAGAASFQPSFQQSSPFSQPVLQQPSPLSQPVLQEPPPFSQPVFRQHSARHFPTAAMQQQMDSEQIRDHFEQRRQNIEDQHNLVAHPHVAQFLDSIFIAGHDDYDDFDATHNDPFAVVNYPKFALKHDLASANFDEKYAQRLAAERMNYRDPNAQNFQPTTSMQY